MKTTDLSESLTFHSVRLSDDEAIGQSSYLQTLQLFNKYVAYLKEKGLDMKTHLVRTWIYISDIDVNYSGVVRARNDIFALYGLTADTHFIASTGIGGDSQSRHACVAIDFLTYPHIVEPQKKYLKASTISTQLTNMEWHLSAPHGSTWAARCIITFRARQASIATET